MTEAADVPLICDPVPGPRLRVLVCNRVLSKEAVARLRAEWDRAQLTGKTIILDSGIELRSLLDDEPQWPDAEFCAA